MLPNGAREASSRDLPGAAKRNDGLAEGGTLFDGVSMTSPIAVWRMERGAFARLSDGATKVSPGDLAGAALTLSSASPPATLGWVLHARGFP